MDILGIVLWAFLVVVNVDGDKHPVVVSTPDRAMCEAIRLGFEHNRDMVEVSTHCRIITFAKDSDS